MKGMQANTWLQFIPLVTIAVSGLGSHYTLQSQVVDLRARYESSNSYNKEALADIKAELKEQSQLLRELTQNGRSESKVKTVERGD